jgi:pSer/pThr/pTyr-binding forkhead associated (FHA) protein
LKGTIMDVRSPLAHVGRGAHNDIVVSDDSISDSHAKLQRREDGWYVVDMGSTNGTYVGGRRIEGEAALVGAPDVRFGGVKFIFRVPEDAKAGNASQTRAIAAVRADPLKAMAGTKTPAVLQAWQRGASPPPAAPPPPPKKTSRVMLVLLWIGVLILVSAGVLILMTGH